MEQIYENYSPEDHQVWSILFNRQRNKLNKCATGAYISGLEKIKFTGKQIPEFSKTNKILQEITGWELHAVPGIVEDKLFFKLIADRKFPATTWLRKMNQLDYLEEPDMFHDVFAHAPLLTNQAFVDFLESLGKIALEYKDNQWAIHLLSRIYWFTIEFGLIRENTELKIYGAGILSSPGETNYALSNKPEHLKYNSDQILNTEYRKDVFQNTYFVIENFEQLFNSIIQIKAALIEHVKKAKTK